MRPQRRLRMFPNQLNRKYLHRKCPVLNLNPQKCFEVDFRVQGTADQLNALKRFMIDNGIKFAPVPKDERKVG